jgi:hypothetical protein
MFSLNNPKNWANPVIPRRSHFVGKLILRITVSDGVTTGEMVIAEEWNVRIARSDRVATPGELQDRNRIWDVFLGSESEER